MSHDERRITVSDGKYTFYVPERDWRAHVLRHGEPWVVIENGCNAVTSLMSELIEARKLVAAVKRWAMDHDPHQHGNLYQAFDRWMSVNGYTRESMPKWLDELLKEQV